MLSSLHQNYPKRQGNRMEKPSQGLYGSIEQRLPYKQLKWFSFTSWSVIFHLLPWFWNYSKELHTSIPGKRKIIHLKVPAGGEYVGSQEGVFNILHRGPFQMAGAGVGRASSLQPFSSLVWAALKEVPPPAEEEVAQQHRPSTLPVSSEELTKFWKFPKKNTHKKKNWMIILRFVVLLVPLKRNSCWFFCAKKKNKWIWMIMMNAGGVI